MQTPALTPYAGSARTARALQAHAAGRTKAHDWALANCCHFASRWMAYATGVDPMASLPPTRDARAAVRLVRQLGGDLAAAWTRQLGRAPVAAALARVGDVVLQQAVARDGVGARVGVCNGERVLLGDGSTVSLADCALAWRLWGDA